MTSPFDAHAQPPVRLDVWLHSVRLAKTRSVAKQMITAGHVRVDDEPAKAAQKVGPGAMVSVRRPGITFQYRVLKPLPKRAGAPIARTAYEDLTPPPPPQMAAAPPRRDRGAGRPTKKERREIDRLRGRESNTLRRG